MAKDKSSKKKGKNASSKKAARLAEKAAKKAAKKGDGSFPDLLVVTREKASDGQKYFFGHADELDTLTKNGEAIGVYKLRKVSTIEIKRKVVR